MATDSMPTPPPISTTVLPSILGTSRSAIVAAVSKSVTVRRGQSPDIVPLGEPVVSRGLFGIGGYRNVITNWHSRLLCYRSSMSDHDVAGLGLSTFFSVTARPPRLTSAPMSTLKRDGRLVGGKRR
jgi:hypothetical protein